MNPPMNPPMNELNRLWRSIWSPMVKSRTDLLKNTSKQGQTGCYLIKASVWLMNGQRNITLTNTKVKYYPI